MTYAPESSPHRKIVHRERSLRLNGNEESLKQIHPKEASCAQAFVHTYTIPMKNKTQFLLAAATFASVLSTSHLFAQAGRQASGIWIRDSGSITLDTSH